MVSYSDFSVQEIITDKSEQTVIVKTNFKVDPESVTMDNVTLYNYDEAKLENYSMSVDNKDIIIKLADPPQDIRYYLKIKNIKDALSRTLKTAINEYITFYLDVKTKVEILSPRSRETLNTKTVSIRLKAVNPEPDTAFHIEIAADNVFFKDLHSLDIPSAQLDENNEIEINTVVDREGQIYIRARAEVDELPGDWSKTICFNILTISMDSLDTTFLEDYLTTEELFEDDIIELPETISRTDIASNNGYFYLEFNKNIKLPSSYELDENGYIKIGTITCFRKGQ